MRAFAWFLGLIVLALAVMAVAGYPAWLLIHPYFDFAFHRIASRIAMLAAAIALALISRRLRLTDRASFGYGLPWRAFLRECALGLAVGVALMAVILLLMGLLGLRVWRADVTLSGTLVASLLITGLQRGLAVALLEETCLRGAMFTAVARESGTRFAILATSLVYALTHFIGRYHIAPEAVNAWSGVALVAGTLKDFAEPAQIADAFVCYFAVGVLLGVVRARTGNIAATLGLHAGFVWIITLASEVSRADPASRLAFLLSSWSGGGGVVGWLVSAWVLIAGVLLARFYRHRAAGRSLIDASNQRT